MEEFVTEIKQNIEKETNPELQKKSSRYFEIVQIISSHTPTIRILENKCGEDGDIRFEVPLYSIGLNYDILLKYKKELMTDFMIDFLGELFVRGNLDTFVGIIMNLKEKYSSTVNRFDHKEFGMRMYRDRLSFIFHVSFIQKIMNEDFKSTIQ